ncbi:hypothetical protein AAE02nite_30650 [Adhaeribacter aerolatus]|uniref:Uncharacterized protein n=1 Tax=Adhaeribacter aerolatus TaxID=670289 RepID=A0A512B0B6_9BACT|nr:hypothetical protein [Adhaeribacter aerolatus]GEO05401.1 hypothetical protein AAE02nite_30650 [Adhaeribacter aerolatus]
MPLNIHFTKALVLASLLILVGMFTFNRIIQQERLKIFQSYSHLQLPPHYEIKQNTAGTGNYRTDVLLIFEFDKQNFALFIHQNKINSGNTGGLSQWQSDGTGLRRKLNIDAQTTVLETIFPAQQKLKFRYIQK